MELIRISRELSQDVSGLEFGPPVTHVYNPLEYARRTHEEYLMRYGTGPKQVLLVGMNPGPFGMAQTGVPFGDVEMVRGWLRIEGEVSKPNPEHPKRPIEGFRTRRGEVSGARLWGWARARSGEPERFFRRFFVWNYCPLCFMEASGRNRTPDKLPAAERDALFRVCDQTLRCIVAATNPKYAVGVGRFAESRLWAALPDSDLVIGHMPHPSPASPAANRGWEAQADGALGALGIRLK